MGLPVLPIFIFDTSILDQLPKNDQRVTFIHQQLESLNQTLATKESSRLMTYYGSAIDVFERLILEFEVKSVICNHDYEPYAKKRDETVSNWLASHGIEFKSYKDQVVFEKNEILKDDGKPYTVFTPYMKKWKSHFDLDLLHSNPSDSSNLGFVKIPPKPILTLESMGFEVNEPMLPTLSLPSQDMLKGYKENRDYPAKKATSRLSVHLRFGTVSIRELVRLAVRHSESWWNELIWREFYMMILWHFPHVAERSFKSAYDLIPWRNDTESFNRWCQGTTGYPLVDAGMRQLNETGFMHNRLRMVTASFLTKHLLIHWQWGEAYFAEKLLDFELSSNNGGWQWAAGSGCDAAPYFRVFNPELQAKKFDPKAEYINTWVKEFGTLEYPQPIVDHKYARKRAIDTYQEALRKH